MLQIDHIYEFLYENLFRDFDLWSCPDGVIEVKSQITDKDILIFTPGPYTTKKIFFYDQEPFIPALANPYIDHYVWETKYTLDEHYNMAISNALPTNVKQDALLEEIEIKKHNPDFIYKQSILATSEKSLEVDHCVDNKNFNSLYYFFHGFAASDWYRGYYALNYNKSIIKKYQHDFVSFNRIIINDRSYRIYFISQLKEKNLLEQGQVSFNVTDNLFDDWCDEVADPNSKLSDKAKLHIEQNLVDINKLIIDKSELPGSASANIPTEINALWHVVTETVFYYDKLHLTEKIFKPIVSKQPFMLLAAPGNLEYLRSYGFKTFSDIIDESYDTIRDHDSRIEAVVKQLQWYCSLSESEKNRIIHALEPIVLHNFHHFYGEFKQIITQELITNTKTLFKDIGYDDCNINYTSIYHTLTH